MTDHDGHSIRGRKRDRSMTRASVSNMRADESSTLRGRSRQRATSPIAVASRNASPSLMSQSRHLLLYKRLPGPRREHCPSRPASPSRRMTTRRPTRSRSRGPRRELEPHRAAEHHSRLRNEVFRNDKDARDKQKG